MTRRYGKNYYLVQELKNTGLSGSKIGEKLGISRERVRQLLCEDKYKPKLSTFKYNKKPVKADLRICSKCNKQFLPRTRYQTTCGCRFPKIFNCYVCGKPSSHKKTKTYPNCNNPECLKVIELRIAERRKEGALSRNHTPVTVKCPICHIKHQKYSWLVRVWGFSIRCPDCNQKQAKTLCEICLTPSSSKKRRCKKHMWINRPLLRV